MFDLDKWQEIFQTLSKNKLRTFLTAFGVGWGIFMLIVMLGAGTGLQNGVNKQFSGFAANSFAMWTQSTSIPYKGFPRGRGFRLNNSDVKAIRDQIPEVDLLAPRNQLGGYRNQATVVRNSYSGAFNVMGDYPDIQHIQLINTVQGRFLNDLDLQERRKVAVIGDRVREVLFGDEEDPLGKYFSINGVYYKLIGVFKSTKPAEQADRDEQTIHLPFTTFQQAYNYGETVSWISMTSQDDVPASIPEEKALQLLKERHSVHPDDVQAFGHFNAADRFSDMNNVFKGINLLTWFVGILTLLAGVIGVSNIMLIIVKERTKEIGIRRAIGASPWAVMSQVILEAVTLTTLAGYFGLITGVGLVEITAYFLDKFKIDLEYFNHPEINLQIVLMSMVVLIVSGMLAGMIPARRAIAISTVDALRDE